LACLLLDRSPPTFINVALAIVQSIILVFALWIRASAIWIIFAVALFASFIAIREFLVEQKQLKRIWSAGVMFAVLGLHTFLVMMTLYPVCRSKGEIYHHMFSHAVIDQLQIHPGWSKKYAASYDFAVLDQMPYVASKKYLERHPPPDPENVFLTPD